MTTSRRKGGRRPKDRVLLVLPFPVFGAAEDYGLVLARGLAGRGVHAQVLVPADLALPADVERSLPAEIEPIRVPEPDLRNIPRLRRTLSRLAGGGVVHLCQPFLPGLAAAAMLPDTACVTTVHTPALRVGYSWKGRVLEWLTARTVDAWIVLSERNRDLLLASGRVPSRRTHVVHPGFPTDRFGSLEAGGARARLGLDSDGFVVGTVGRIDPQKRHDVLIRACALAGREIDDLRLVIVGDGALRAEIESLARTHLPGRVVFAGHRRDAVALLPAFDVFALTSDFEGLPFALLEAMAMRRTIVATDVQGSGEAIRHGRDGLLVPPGSPDAVAEALVRLRNDRELARGMGEAARQRFRALFTAERMVDGTIDVYRRAVSRGRKDLVGRTLAA